MEAINESNERLLEIIEYSKNRIEFHKKQLLEDVRDTYVKFNTETIMLLEKQVETFEAELRRRGQPYIHTKPAESLFSRSSHESRL